MKIGRKNKQEAPRPSALDAPVIDLVIRYDGRNGQMGLMVIGGTLTPEGVYQLLEMARGWMRAEELRALKSNGGQAVEQCPPDQPAS